ncbi:mitochondrial ribosomal protein subunit [Colletotrichum sojae]|uniref:Mitochondrial ribosomal protein subunit n=1 Tax=Colletotrichum sojae TaxID=2175907 RepID=A0A8H6JW50_9PEZI|nr:mitochondrial ribosomal protein subunit [Colletotrichum sojae]
MSARLSPGGALLRSSRMFSVPKPLPPPGGDAANILRYQSPTMTTAYPTHQSITTPESSRALGDWGFKRSLPVRKTTKSSTPVVRIKQIDSIESVTDYASAADHTISLQKFQELNLPLSQPGPGRSRLAGMTFATKSVFEDDADFTALEPGCDEHKRWKFNGPWLAGLTSGEFNRFVEKKVRNKREEFRAFLKERLAAEKTAEEHQKSLDAGTELPQQVLARDITDEEVVDYQRRLRADRVRLYSLISEFLDLAPLQPPTSLMNFTESTLKMKTPSLYAENGPPPSHPSAGLSYLRTASVIENHPVYGPQAQQAPVLARIISPRTGPASAKLGVGGFVTDTPPGDTAFNLRSIRGTKNTIAGIAAFDPDIKGGAKAFVSPTSAHIESNGKVVITLAEASDEAQLVTKEMVGKAKIYNDRTEPEQPPAQPLMPLAGRHGAPFHHTRTFRPFRAENTQKPQEQPIGSSGSYGLDLS